MIYKLLIATILTGLISGIFISIYELLIIFTTYFLFAGDPAKTIPKLPIWYVYFVPTVAIFFVNYIISKDKFAKEYGVSEIAESIAQNKMKLKIKTLFLKIIASVISLSSGFSVGTEGPSAGIGAMIAYQIHKFLKLPSFLIKMIISVGASSGIAAIFVSPVTGIAFAVENIAYQFIKRYIGYLILASVVAFAISVQFLEPIIFKFSNGKNFNNTYIIANLIFIFYITFFIYLYLFLKRKVLHFIDLKLFKKISKYRNYIFALIGGGVIGTILLINPNAAFSGKNIVTSLINQTSVIPISLIFVIIILRIIGTSISIYANAVGGIFLPLMSIGALIGYSFGEILNLYQFNLEPFYFAAIGAAVFMGVIMKLPLTAVVLAVETTFDYNIVVATGVCVVIADFLTSINFKLEKKQAVNKD
jgi:CIC family chloride channel protein